ncbi:lysylphosphatidylglycerol synthase domain-containing protein [Kineococcus sp. NPDC059986]|uniref:lysylphosphatidylglycerol synthase domain-containing protein n=1 Tax=Kineococcus sp. NPDC059986 TaxID=3155538 RepID=UPI003450E943
MLSLAAAAGAVVALPRLVGTTWSTVGGLASAVTPVELAALAALWWLGLWAYAWSLTGALPGLTRPRAMLLNLSGSAVSNALPAGGAVGMWLNSTMLRGWGFGVRRIADFTVTSNVVDVAGKLVVCGVALAATALLGQLPSQVLTGAAVVLAVLAAVVVLAAALGSRWGVALLARVVLALSPASRRAARLRFLARWRVELRGVRRRVRQTVVAQWRRLTFGVIAYVLLQGGLFWACLHLTGAVPTVSAVVAAFVVDRLISTVPITPGGSGFAEAGATGVLLAAGAGPAAALTGVLLYRAFVVLLEVPVGGGALAGWLVLRRRAGATA